jgi:hypothetical protein
MVMVAFWRRSMGILGPQTAPDATPRLLAAYGWHCRCFNWLRRDAEAVSARDGVMRVKASLFWFCALSHFQS